jgi:lipid A disaccharide synthetase
VPTVILRNASDQLIAILPFDYIGYKRLSENNRFPNHRWYSDATWGEMGNRNYSAILATLQINRNYSAILVTLQITSYVHSRNSS